MERDHRDLGWASLSGSSYDRLARGGETYLDRDPPLRESYLGSPLGSSSHTGRSGYSGGSGIMQSLLQQRALEEQLSLRESQLELANSLLRQQQKQEQHQQVLNKRQMDGTPAWGDLRKDFKRPRLMDNRSPPKNRSTGQGSNARGRNRGARGSSGNQRNQNAPRGRGQGSADRSKSFMETYDSEWPTVYDPRNRSTGQGLNARGRNRGARGSSGNQRNQNAPRGRGQGSADRSKSFMETYYPEWPIVDDEAVVRRRSKAWCSLCNAEFKDWEGLERHKTSKQHKGKVASSKANSDPKNQNKGRFGNKVQVQKQRMSPKQKAEVMKGCDMCGITSFKGFKDVLAHRASKKHMKLQVEKKKMSQKQKMQVARGCGWCNVTSFENFSEVLEHRATEEHIKNRALYGKDREEMTNSKSEPGGRKEQEHIEVELPPELSKFDPTVVVGETCMSEVTGWFCKACKMFCNSENTSKETHCLTELHFNNYKKFMYAKLKREAREARQKAAEEEGEKKEAEAEAAAENKEGGDGDNANTTTAPSTEQQEVDSQELSMGAEGAEGAEVGEKNEGEAAVEDSAEESMEEDGGEAEGTLGEEERGGI